MPEPLPQNLRAAVHIGASHASMIILRIFEDGSEERLDFLEKNIPLGRDIFGYGRVRSSTIEQAVDVVHGFQSVLSELGLSDLPVRAVTTNTLEEATGRPTLALSRKRREQTQRRRRPEWPDDEQPTVAAPPDRPELQVGDVEATDDPQPPA